MWAEISNYHWTWMGFGFIHMTIILSLLVLAIVMMLRYNSSENTQPLKQEILSPSDILKLRYVRGEISKQQFEQNISISSKVTK